MKTVTFVASGLGLILNLVSMTVVWSPTIYSSHSIAPTVAQAASHVGCEGEDWCIELNDVAIEINNKGDTWVERLRQMGEMPGAPDMTLAT
jgi:hypothetical protein